MALKVKIITRKNSLKTLSFAYIFHKTFIHFYVKPSVSTYRKTHPLKIHFAISINIIFSNIQWRRLLDNFIWGWC
jgi:hypothetical protein